jgi:hypothetical protein
LLDARLKRDPAERDRVLHAARNFQHLGLYVVPEVPVAEKNDFAAIVTLNQKIERLTGRSLGQLSPEFSDAPQPQSVVET